MNREGKSCLEHQHKTPNPHTSKILILPIPQKPHPFIQPREPPLIPPPRRPGSRDPRPIPQHLQLLHPDPDSGPDFVHDSLVVPDDAVAVSDRGEEGLGVVACVYEGAFPVVFLGGGGFFGGGEEELAFLRGEDVVED